jgi:N-acetylglucosamine repressor
VRTVRRRGAISRSDLARELGLVASTAGIYVDRLVRNGYLIETTRPARGLGRPPVFLEINPRASRFIGVDFDARQLMAVSVDFAQEPLEQVCRTLPARPSAENVLSTIEESIHEVIGSDHRDLMGIGLGVPGPIDADRGIALAYKFIRDWKDVPIGPRIAARFPAPVFVENNLRSMALGELWTAPGSGLRNLVCLGVRSGIGSGIIVDGKLVRGANNVAGEIGRWVYPEDSSGAGDESSPPRTIEDVASLTALLAEAAERLAQGEDSTLGKRGDRPTIAELLAAAARGDGLAHRLVEKAARIHGWIIHQLVLVLDPEQIVVAGPLVESDVYLDALHGAFARLGSPQLGSRVVRSNLGALAGARGAAALAFHHWKPRR